MDRSFLFAMFGTHLPYIVISVAIIVVARRTRRTVEHLVAELEELARRRP